MKIRTAILALSLLTAAPLALTLAGAQEDDSAAKGAFVRFVENTISTPDRKIELGAIDGALSSDVRLASITISDREGVWLRIDGVHLVWSRLALLRGTLDVDSLDADRIEVSRKPLPPEGADPAASEGFALPDLPVAVKIGRIAAPEVRIGAPVLGQEARLSVNASGQLSDGSLNADLAIERIDDKPGEVTLKAAYAAEDKHLDLDLKVSEPANGVIANLLNLPDRPSVRLALTGSGPLSEFAADLDLATNDVNRLSGRTSITREGDAYRFGSSLTGDLAALVPADYALYLAGETKLDLAGRVADAGPIDIERFAITAPVVTLNGSAALAADGFPTAVELDGRLAARDGALPLGGASADTRLGEGRLRFSLGKDNRWSIDVAAERLAAASFSADTIALNGGGVAADLADATKRRIDFTLSGGSTGLKLADPATAKAVGGELAVSGSGRWQAGAPLTIDALKLMTPTAEARFAGKVEDGRIDGRQSLAAASLAPFSDLAGRSLTGGIDLAAEGALTPTTGAFDLTLDGKASDLGTGIARVDGLLSGETRLTGRLGRDTSGLTLQAFRVANPALTLTADGHHARAATNLVATLTLPDASRIEAEAKGAVGATVSLTGSGGPLDLKARLASERIVVRGNALEALGIDLGGRIDEGAFAGTINGNGRIKGQPLTLKAGLASAADGSRRLDGLDLRVADTKASGDLALDTAGLMTGRLAVASPDLSVLSPLVLTDIAGRLSAKVDLMPRGGAQGATIDLDAANLSAAGARVSSATVKATAADLLGTPKIDGRFDVKGVSHPLATVASLTGTAQSAGSATAFDIKASGIASPQLTDAGLTGFALTANGRLEGNRVNLAAARLTGPDGLGGEAKGVIPLTGNGLAVDATAKLPLALAQRFVAERGTRFSGTANAAIRVGGSLSAPDISGRVMVAGGSVSDPLTTMRLDGIDVAMALSADSVRIERATATVKGGGRLSASGTLGLAGGLPVDVTIAADKARVTDGSIGTADLGARLAVGGSLSSGLKIAGSVDVARAELTLPEGGAAGGALLDVKHRNTPADVAATLKHIDKASGGRQRVSSSLPIALDVAIRAPRQIFVRGRGIDAEVGGNVTLRGTLAAVEPVGSFKLIRGRIVVIGQRINLDEGEVTLTGDLNPYIALSATSKSDSIAVTATVEGYATDPSIVLTSTPELPQDEILARFLFRRSIDQLSALQIAQLAEAVTQLAGGGNGNGLIDSLRSRVGLDDLDLTTDSEGNAAVKAGRYISEKVYLGVTAGGAGQSGVSVNLDITDDVKAKAEATQSQSKVGVYFEREY